ncbi:MAG: aspartate aminotransferase family protein [Caldisericia bacterium]
MNKDELIKIAESNVLPHYAFIKEIREKSPKIIVEGKGAKIFDIDGKEYIDGLSILWTVNIGHGRKEIIDALKEQLDKINYASLFGGYFNEPAIKLADKLAKITPSNLKTSFFISGGSEAVESAIKFVRQYWAIKGIPEKKKIISRRESYHGVTYGALSATGLRIYRQPFEPLLPFFLHVSPPYCYRCDFGKDPSTCNAECAKQIKDLIHYEGARTIAAIIMEPVMSAAGALVPPKKYFEVIQEIAKENQILIIADEVINAWGRCGDLFASNIFNLDPDIMIFGKGITSGYAPLGAMIVKEELSNVFIENMFVHGHTFGGHCLSTVAALKNIELIEDEKLYLKAKEKGEILAKLLKELYKHKRVGDIRGIGLHWAIEYVKNKETKESIPSNIRFAMRVEEAAYRRGLYLCRASVDKTYIAPPLVIEDEDIKRIVEILDESIDEASRSIEI